MQVTSIQAKSMITKLITVGLVPMLWGSPGIGKSSIVHDIAKEYNLKVIDKRLSQEEPTDLKGFPTVLNTKGTYLPMDDLPVEGDAIPEGYSGWMIFLDELPAASPSIQKAAFKLILDRMVGNRKLHKNVVIVAAGNLETDNAGVEAMNTALQSRMVHMELVSDVESWLEWAYSNDVNPWITSYIKFKPTQLYRFSPEHTDKTYACNRTWEFANRVMKNSDLKDPDLLPMLAGTLSEGVAREFLGFCKIEKDLPKIPQIMAQPEDIKVPEEPSILFALTGSLAHNMTDDNVDQLLKFINRLPKEFQVITLKESVRRKKELMATPAMRKWITTSSVELF